MAKRAKKNKEFVIRCAHCLESDFRLTDVKPDEKIKYYTDTPFKKPFVSPNASSAAKVKALLSPPKRFNAEDDTALKTNYISSSNGKLFHRDSSPFKVQNLEELAYGLPHLDDIEEESPKVIDPSMDKQQMDVEEIK